MSNSEGIDPAMLAIKKKVQTNELDYQFVMDCLRDYKSPRAKLSRLIRSGALIRIKKGLYLLGQQFKLNPYSLELLANLVYGPSYISLERALQIYGMIPEYVAAVTSITTKPSKEFRTPVGDFLYSHSPLKSYSVGITRMAFDEKEHPFFIATPEKALIDTLIIRKGKITSIQQMNTILLEDLRLVEDDLLQLNLKLIKEIYMAYPHSAVDYFEKWLSQRKRNS